jgi:hypothetical protein
VVFRSLHLQGQGLLGTIKEKLGMGGASAGGATAAASSGASAEQEVREKVEAVAPGTPERGVIKTEGAEEWRRAEAETVRAEHSARAADVITARADVLASQVTAAKDIK